MSTVATTKMSSKGQIVIPEEIRRRLNLKSGSRFMVLGDKDIVILKNISPPSMDEFNDLIKQARQKAKETGFHASDLKSIISEIRK
jgi:AbrB family looped-hinge helix DNA binding protein